MNDTERYTGRLAMLEYNVPLIMGMAGRPEYVAACLQHVQPWLDQEVAARHYKALADFTRDAHGVWKALASRRDRVTNKVKRDATEILRRAERALILAILAGQEAGEIGKQGEKGGWDTKVAHTSHLMTIEEATGMKYAWVQEMRPMGLLTSEQFERALVKARSARLSRTAIVRIAAGGGEQDGADWVPHRLDRTSEASVRRRQLIRSMAREGKDSRQMMEVLGTQDVTIRQMAREIGVDIPADTVTARTKHIRASRVVTEAIGALEGVAMSLELASVWELDRDSVREQRRAMARAVRQISAYMADMRTREETDLEHASSNATA